MRLEAAPMSYHDMIKASSQNTSDGSDTDIHTDDDMAVMLFVGHNGPSQRCCADPSRGGVRRLHMAVVDAVATADGSGRRATGP